MSRTMILIFVILGVFVNYCNCACSDWKDCSSCTTHQSWSGDNCRWCELDMGCHAFGAIITNNCSVFENIDDVKYCGCTVPPIPGYGSDVCSWYLGGSTTGNPPSNTSLWKGGDFLPPSYASAGNCACVGNGNKLWLTDAASCVRSNLIRAHIAIPADTKQALRTATLSGNPVKWAEFTGMFQDFHIAAYKNCGCPGAPAPYVDWLGIVLGGEILPCPTIIDAILQFGRCGCGW